MSEIADLVAAGQTLSFEFFPPKTPAGIASLHRTIADLAVLEPAFISVTYGAGGNVRNNTRDLVLELAAQWPFPVMPHLTCVGHSYDDIMTLLNEYAHGGVEHVLALAGDPQPGHENLPEDFHYASELVTLVKEQFPDFGIGVAAFPETHPRSLDRTTDRKYLAEKLAASDFAITQLFFDAEDYFSLVDELAELGCTKPILPGIIPVLNPTTVRHFAETANSKIPEELFADISAHESTSPERFELAVTAAAALAQELLDGGVPGLHFFTLNRADATKAIVERLNW